MLQYRNVTECLDAIERGRIVDQEDNKVPAQVVDALLRAVHERGIFEGRLSKRAYGVRHHVRYVGSRAIHWFS